MRRLAKYHREHFLHAAEDMRQGLLNEFAEPSGHSLADDQTLIVLCSADDDHGVAKKS